MLFCCCNKYHDQEQLEEGFIWLTLPGHSQSLREVRRSLTAREVWQEQWRRLLAAGWLPDSGLASFLLQPRTTSPENGGTHSGLGCSTSISNKDNAHRCAHRPV